MFIVIELQKTATEQVANIVNSYTDQNEAESRYHQILAAAAVSAVPLHAAVMLEDDGHEIKHEWYRHEREEET